MRRHRTTAGQILRLGLHLTVSETDNGPVTVAGSRDDFHPAGSSRGDADSIDLAALARLGPPNSQGQRQRSVRYWNTLKTKHRYMAPTWLLPPKCSYR